MFISKGISHHQPVWLDDLFVNAGPPIFLAIRSAHAAEILTTWAQVNLRIRCCEIFRSPPAHVLIRIDTCAGGDLKISQHLMRRLTCAQVVSISAACADLMARNIGGPAFTKRSSSQTGW